MGRYVYQGETSFKPRVYLQQSLGVGKTGLSESSSLTITLTQDGNDPSTLSKQAVSVIGTYESPTLASQVRIGEVDSVRTPGYYELHFHNTLLANLDTARSLDLHIYSSGGLILDYHESFNVYQANPEVDIDGKTHEQALKIIAAACAGESSGAGTGTEVFKGLDGNTTRVSGDVDQDGNRSNVVYG